MIRISVCTVLYARSSCCASCRWTLRTLHGPCSHKTLRISSSRVVGVGTSCTVSISNQEIKPKSLGIKHRGFFSVKLANKKKFFLDSASLNAEGHHNL